MHRPGQVEMLALNRGQQSSISPLNSPSSPCDGPSGVVRENSARRLLDKVKNFLSGSPQQQQQVNLPAPSPLPSPTPVRLVPIPEGPTDGMYVFTSRIGSGTFGRVHLAYHFDRPLDSVVVKEYRPHHKDVSMASVVNHSVREINALEILHGHPNIIKLISTYRCDALSTTQRLVMEYCTGDTLLDYLQKHSKAYGEPENCFFREPQVRIVMKQLLSALSFAHREHRIYNMDVKAENIMFARQPWHSLDGSYDDDTLQIRLIDWGFSISLSREDAADNVAVSTKCGSDHYMPPEIFLEESAVPAKADAWSSGVVLYTMLYYRLPWLINSPNTPLPNQTRDALLNAVYNPIPPTLASFTARDLVRQLLELRVDRRLCPTKALKHAWFSEPMSSLIERTISDKPVITANP